MSAHISLRSDKLAEAAMKAHPSHDARSALRCALGDASALIDAMATEVLSENTVRSYVKKRAREDALLLKRAADAIWAMREKVRHT